MVNRAAKDSVVARIVTLVEEASATKARTQLFIEKVEQRYSVGVVVATLAIFSVPSLWGAAFEPTLLRAMTFMIVASPCAVVLATMPPLLSTIANAGRHGVLVKSAVALEKFGQSTVVAFDKTGTLTDGTPRVSEVEPVPASGVTEDLLLALAAAAERPSEHPLARAVVAAAQRARARHPPRRGVLLHARPRRRGAVWTTSGVQVGSPALLRELSPSSSAAVRRRRPSSAGWRPWGAPRSSCSWTGCPRGSSDWRTRSAPAHGRPSRNSPR